MTGNSTYQRVANFILAYDSIPIRTIVIQTGLSGTEVRKVISFFEKQGLITVDTSTNKVKKTS